MRRTNLALSRFELSREVRHQDKAEVAADGSCLALPDYYLTSANHQLPFDSFYSSSVWTCPPAEHKCSF